ncbi:hypothetical protein MPTK1_8g07980 [Marchantia polymorpha subsp. ruderalis]|uniref:Uncharacterized protein n=1 Tax=Marchantia polymorpha TaxID=3197 RepID=A0A2R6W4H2_MARPO|nr:hypothetical protein MARPO_0155s0019 [Marchantia polymorpha]BBN19113.1 hypothetical protein Mp_8g07980 [Marchantia polymorpha subsp. ruderalis]|eukprot:PTQ28757.1 hypothetical protein MARPO_0155s0019 [Marchantia polymorpha]
MQESEGTFFTKAAIHIHRRIMRIVVSILCSTQKRTTLVGHMLTDITLFPDWMGGKVWFAFSFAQNAEQASEDEEEAMQPPV